MTRLIRVIVERSPFRALPTILLTVGLVPFLLTGLFLALVGPDVRPIFLGSQLLAATLPAVGAVLIWRYDTVVFPTFIERITEVTPYDDNREIQRIAGHYGAFFANVRATTAIWTGLVLVAVIVNDAYFRSLGVTGYTDPSYFVYGLFAAWAGAITAVGIRMALTTILCIREIGDLDFTIDPLHPDGLGGLSNIGYFAIRTTSILSIGALGLPLAFDVVRVSGGSGVIYALVGFYILLLVGSFAFPTVYINRRANEIKQESLDDKREQIHELRTRLLASDDPEEIEPLQMKLAELRKQYETYDAVNLYPMSLSIASRLASSVLLPLFFLVIETYVL
ncbi:hypothetical protein ACFR9U_20270 [Halorientalis brevis]|uniref:Uncharacterized protein n=1 Tax=Halorientalis brevis TaxID=1126241 RepID=A0ABD6CGG1_9EURY|nr:hypothetical protein [Halorientalis brevis]